jgi:hypothetical protein
LVTIGITRLISRTSRPALRIGWAVVAVAVSAVVLTRHLQTADDALWRPGLPGVWSAAAASPDAPPGDALGEGATVFSNRPSVIYSVTGRTTMMLPQDTVSANGRPNPRKDRSWDELVEVGREHPVVVVLVKASFDASALEADLRRRFTVEPLADTASYLVLRLSPQA